MAPSHGYNLRRRKPKRTDLLLTEIYDALPDDLLRGIACRAIYARDHGYFTLSEPSCILLARFREMDPLVAAEQRRARNALSSVLGAEYHLDVLDLGVDSSSKLSSSNCSLKTGCPPVGSPWANRLAAVRRVAWRLQATRSGRRSRARGVVPGLCSRRAPHPE